MRASAIAGKSWLALAGLVFLVLVLDVVWIAADHGPPRMYDDAWYLSESVELYRALTERGLGPFFREALVPALDVHPPMMKILPVPLYFAFGPEYDAALFAYALLIPVFCVYLYFLARELFDGDSTVALVATAVTCSFPLTYGMWRNLMMEFGTAVATVAVLYHLLKTDGFRHRGHAAAAGALTGWGLLWKVSFPLFILGPALYLFLRRDRARLATALGNAGVLCAAGLAVAGPFYATHGVELLRYVGQVNEAGGIGDLWSMGPVFAPSTLYRYWLTIVNTGFSPYWFVWLVAGTCIHFATRKASWLASRQSSRSRHSGRVPARAPWFLAAWFVPSMLVLSFQVIKEIRHGLPAYPALGIVAAALLVETLGDARGVRRAVAMGLFFVFPAYTFAALSFDGVPRPREDVRAGPLVLVVADPESASFEISPTYAFPAHRSRWPTREAVELVAATWEDARRAPTVRMVGEHPLFNGIVLQYESVLARAPLESHGPYQVVGSLSEHWDYVITLCGASSGAGMDYREPEVEQAVASGRLPYRAIGKLHLPIGCDAVVYRKMRPGESWS